MTPFTRRRALHAVAGILAGLAGCPEGTDSGAEPSPTEPADGSGEGDPDSRSADQFATDPDHVVLRAPRESPVAWFADDSLETPGTTVSPGEGRTRGLVASEATAETLAFADVDGARAARSLVEETDFDAETLYLEAHTVGECYRLELCLVEWDRTEIRTDYAQVLRDHDARCRADARETASVLVRVPAALDPGVVTGYGSGIGTGACPPPPGERREPRREDDEDVPPIGNATDARAGTAGGGDGP